MPKISLKRKRPGTDEVIRKPHEAEALEASGALVARRPAPARCTAPADARNFQFAPDDVWHLFARCRSIVSSPKKQFVYHNAGMAGLGGFGGSSYIDGVILRERDANTAWASAADGTLEKRLYYVQNWRADVVAIVTSAGKLVERVRYSSYGIPTAFPAGDTDCDGDWDATDAADIGSNYTPGSAYAVRRDTDLDGDVDAADITHANSITGGYQTLGRDVLTSTAARNRIGYAGYQYDPTFAGADRHLFHVRHRVYDAEAGRWTRRDPLGYVDGMGLYEYVRASPLALQDPFGLVCTQPDYCFEPPTSPMPIIRPQPSPPVEDRPGRRWIPNPFFDHDRFGAYFKWRLVCPGNAIIEDEGWDRVDRILAELRHRAQQDGRCIEYFEISTHHQPIRDRDGDGIAEPGIAYSCDQYQDAVEDTLIAQSLYLCDNAKLKLSMCNSCILARQIEDNNRDPLGRMRRFTIICTDGTNFDHPGLDFNPTPILWFPWPGDKDKLKWKFGITSASSSLGSTCHSYPFASTLR